MEDYGNKNTFDRQTLFGKRVPVKSDYPYNVHMLVEGNNKILHCPLRNVGEVNDHLDSIKKFNKKRIVYIRVYKKGELVKEWRNLNFGT